MGRWVVVISGRPAGHIRGKFLFQRFGIFHWRQGIQVVQTALLGAGLLDLSVHLESESQVLADKMLETAGQVGRPVSQGGQAIGQDLLLKRSAQGDAQEDAL